MKPVARPSAGSVAGTWSRESIVVLAICILGLVLDVYEQTVMQIVTPILIKEWAITPATIGTVTTIGRWVGLIGILVFPALADLYGRKPLLILSIVGYSLFSGLTGFATGWMTLLIFTSINRVALSGEVPVGNIMVTETAPARWRGTALAVLGSSFPFGYMLCTLTASAVVPAYGWRALYFLGVLPALLVVWIRIGVKETPRYQRVTAAMIKQGLRQQLDLWSPVRSYPREMLIASLIYFFYLFTWIGWSAWIPQFLATEKKLGFQTAVQYLSVWMFVAIFAYWICGWLSDQFGRRLIIPAFAMPAAVFVALMGFLNDPNQLFWAGLLANFLILGSFGIGIGYTGELFPTQIRGTAVGAAYTFGVAAASLAPAIVGWIATSHSIAAGLPLLAFSFFALGPLFLFAAPETARQELADFVGETP
ncbi:MAG TPA: MFS transporter [Pseudolabrys sp.]|nr:MFS transporter [Pseudolabrys sp.]